MKRTFSINWMMWMEQIRIAANLRIMKTKVLLKLKEDPNFCPLPGEYLHEAFYQPQKEGFSFVSRQILPVLATQDTFPAAREYCVCFMKFYIRFSLYSEVLLREKHGTKVLKAMMQAKKELDDPDFVKSDISAVWPIPVFSYDFCMGNPNVNYVPKRPREEGERVCLHPDCPKQPRL